MFQQPVRDAGRPRASILCGLIGSGIAGSRSPEMHETEARALGLTMVYRILDGEVMGYGAADLPRLLPMLGAMGFDGLNVTHPFKQDVIPLLDSLSDAAKALGAVNTILFRDGRTHGDNSDWSGYRAHFLAGLGDRPRGRVAMIGAGGAAAAVGYAHLDLGAARLAIFDPARDRAVTLADRLSYLFPTADVSVAATAAEAIAGADGVVQASPIGMESHPGLPFDPDLLTPDQWVSDIIYFPLETPLLAAAAAKGCATLNGGGMAVMQAAHAFARFTGVEPDSARMMADFDHATQRSARA
ncbi:MULTISPECIES: shikimate dehydrogenase [unclassified Sphingobium]|uniref:shikimate dehydrogenase n=1 Tax=unclassified Sphingobium TaxID=2611147 RepID=UPI0007F47575|nr:MULTISPECIES: shikimate dehydrogenase [unclassified Sphingobium]OAN52541.1 shikimate dehydrogenase [Sphingobium sp. TCM1]WIW90853.1 shikimate dehydrogenase [Sphingobium sp. V4]